MTGVADTGGREETLQSSPQHHECEVRDAVQLKAEPSARAHFGAGVIDVLQAKTS